MRVGAAGRAASVRAVATATALLVGFVLGLAAAVLMGKEATGTVPSPPRSNLPDAEQAVTADRRSAVEADPEPPGQADPENLRTPVAAVEAFIAAEAAGDFATSYRLLSGADRDAVGSEAAWVAAHAHLPPLTGHGPGQVITNGDQVSVTTEVTLRAGLDDVAGLIPASAHATFVLVDEPGGWRVAYARSRVEPVYPPPSGAAVVVRRWAGERLACRPAAAEHVSGLLGVAALADRICGAASEVRVGDNRPLDDPVDAVPFVAAYGADAVDWARVVRLEAPVPLRAVAAPVGDEWQVIGVLEDR